MFDRPYHRITVIGPNGIYWVCSVENEYSIRCGHCLKGQLAYIKNHTVVLRKACRVCSYKTQAVAAGPEDWVFKEYRTYN